MRRSLAGALAVLVGCSPASPSWASAVQAVSAPAAGSPVRIVPLAAPAVFGLAPMSAGSMAQPTLGLSTLQAISSPKVALSPSALTGARASALEPLPVSLALQTVPSKPASAPAAHSASKTSPVLPAPLADVVGHPTAQAAARQETLRARARLSERVAGLQLEQSKDSKTLPAAGGEASRGLAHDGFSRLLGMGAPARAELETPVSASHQWGPPKLSRLLDAGQSEHPETPAPPAVPAQTMKGLRTYLAGTAVFKVGMDALSLAVPLMALTTFGSAGWAATFTVVWVLSQAVSSSLAGGMLDRRSPVKVLSWTMALQAVAVAGMVGLCALDAAFPALLGFKLANPYTLLTLHSLAGAMLGISDTARQVLPPRMVGTDERALKLFNAKTHTVYEIAGVSSALLAGLSIKFLGLLPTLMIHPPAYLLAAFLFSRLRLGEAARRAPAEGPSASKPSKPASNPVKDLLEGARTLLSQPVFLWSAVAVVVPLVLHKLFEGLLLPVTAKTLLSDPSSAAWMLGASNLGELLGALLLMKVMASPKAGKRQHSYFWVQLMGFGLLALWCLALSRNLWILLPMAAAKSLTWAASDLSLRSKLQNSLPEDRRGRALGFMNSAAFLLTLAASLGTGLLMDAFAPLTVLYWVAGAATALAALMVAASRKLRVPAGAVAPPAVPGADGPPGTQAAATLPAVK